MKQRGPLMDRTSLNEIMMAEAHPEHAVTWLDTIRPGHGTRGGPDPVEVLGLGKSRSKISAASPSRTRLTVAWPVMLPLNSS